MLQHFEQLSSVFAQAVSVWSTEYGVRAIIGEVIRSVLFLLVCSWYICFILYVDTNLMCGSILFFIPFLGKLVRSQVKSLPERVQVSSLMPLFCQNSVAWYQSWWSPTSLSSSPIWKERFVFWAIHHIIHTNMKLMFIIDGQMKLSKAREACIKRVQLL